MANFIDKIVKDGVEYDIIQSGYIHIKGLNGFESTIQDLLDQIPGFDPTARGFKEYKIYLDDYEKDGNFETGPYLLSTRNYDELQVTITRTDSFGITNFVFMGLDQKLANAQVLTYFPTRLPSISDLTPGKSYTLKITSMSRDLADMQWIECEDEGTSGGK